MSTAQLKTMHLNETGPHYKLAKVLENVKHVREQYENKVAEQEHSILESNVHNSIGLSSSSSSSNKTKNKKQIPLVKATDD